MNTSVSQSVVGLFLVLILTFVNESESHGFLKEPPSRSSMWCLGYDTRPNYQHNELNCGGWQHLIQQNGRCGVCGDPFDRIRQNEAGGIYAQGLITRVYHPGEIIPIVVNLTATHGGWFEFRLCANNDVNKAVTQSCLDENLLVKADNSGETRYTGVPFGGYTNPAYIEMLYRLPEDVTCQQCVIQWQYTAAQNPGFPIQEMFLGCSDIAIVSVQDPRPDITLPKVSSVTCSKPKDNSSTLTSSATTTTPVPTTGSSRKSTTKSSTQATTSKKPQSSETTKTLSTISVGKSSPPPSPPPTRRESRSTQTLVQTVVSSTTNLPQPATTGKSNDTTDTLTFDILYKRCKAKGVLEEVFTGTCRLLCSLPKSCLRTFCNTSCLLLEKYIT